jgi:hypothetical protein
MYVLIFRWAPPRFEHYRLINGHQEKCQYFSMFFSSFKSPVGLLSKDMVHKVQKVKVKVQKDNKKTKSKRQSNDTFPDVTMKLEFNSFPITL